jgi:hypothetical protein
MTREEFHALKVGQKIWQCFFTDAEIRRPHIREWYVERWGYAWATCYSDGEFLYLYTEDDINCYFIDEKEARIWMTAELKKVIKEHEAIIKSLRDQLEDLYTLSQLETETVN